MQIQPILAALKKHKLATFLIAMEIALACAVLINATSMIATNLAKMGLVSGVDESSLGIIVVNGFDPKQAVDVNARMVAGLQAVPGVESVHVVSTVPFGPEWGAGGIGTDQSMKHTPAVIEFYEGDPGSTKALGLKLVAGSWPSAGDYQPQPKDGYFPNSSRVLMTRELAEKLWPGENPLGKTFWSSPNQFRVVGIIANLAMAQPAAYQKRRPGYSVFVPMQPGARLSGTYLIRAKPQDLQRVMTAARAAVPKIAPDVVLDHADSHTIGYLRSQFFKTDRSMAGLLIGVIVALLGVTALGIVGLASFWVSQRTKQIGIRRALGATRGDILAYFQTENFLIVTFGIVMGVILAIGINILLMQHFEVARLPLWYLPVGAVVLWILGQLAVLAPALRAAAVQPVVATRSV
ncbi:MAG TPA: FtsX-like permease family protein [Rhodanobacteraceae bacterium]